MGITHKLAFVLVLLACLVSGGTSWWKIWLEPNPLTLTVGSSVPYTVKGTSGPDYVQGEITNSPYLAIASSDSSILAVDRSEHRLIAKDVGHAEIRISFSGCNNTSKVTVVAASPR